MGGFESLKYSYLISLSSNKISIDNVFPKIENCVWKFKNAYEIAGTNVNRSEIVKMDQNKKN